MGAEPTQGRASQRTVVGQGEPGDPQVDPPKLERLYWTWVAETVAARTDKEEGQREYDAWRYNRWMLVVFTGKVTGAFRNIN